MNDVIAIIPARAGSKGIREKNKKEFSGLPLVEHTIIAATKTPDIDLLVSTDDANITKLASNYEIDTSYTRPEALSGDETSMYDVVAHALDHLRRCGKRYSTVIILQPTSPLRSEKHIIEALSQYRASSQKVLFSVSPMMQHPTECIVENEMKTDCKTVPVWKYLVEPTEATRRQDYVGQFWFINGAIYIYDISHLLKNGRTDLTGGTIFKMSSRHGIDIDEPLDWALAECAFNTK